MGLTVCFLSLRVESKGLEVGFEIRFVFFQILFYGIKVDEIGGEHEGWGEDGLLDLT